MYYKRLWGLCLLLSSIIIAPNAQSAYWSPHIGVDAMYWGVKPSFQYDELFPHINKGINLYVGSRVNGYFGFDIGYEQSSRKQKGQVFQGGEIIFATPENFLLISPEQANDAATIDIRLRTFHFDANFYWEVVRRLEVMFVFGVANMMPATHVFHLTDGNWIEYKNHSPSKLMGRIGLGLQFNPTPCLGIRFLFHNENTQRIKYTGFDDEDNLFDIKPYKSSITYKLGVVYSFSPIRR